MIMNRIIKLLGIVILFSVTSCSELETEQPENNLTTSKVSVKEGRL